MRTKSVFSQAIDVREILLGLLLRGVSGFEERTGRPANAKSLEDVLGYSETTLRHAVAFQGMLVVARMAAISYEYDDLFHPDPNVDIVFRQEGPNPVYYLAANLTASRLARLGGDFLNVAIMQNNDTQEGVWIGSYHFAKGDDTSPERIASSNLWPEKNMVLQFWLSPKRLDGKYLFQHIPSSQLVRNHMSLLDESFVNGFRHFSFAYDALRHAEIEKTTHYIDDRNVKYAGFLRNRGNFIFSVVEIGTAVIGGETHWIYTGSEKIEKTEQV